MLKLLVEYFALSYETLDANCQLLDNHLWPQWICKRHTKMSTQPKRAQKQEFLLIPRKKGKYKYQKAPDGLLKVKTEFWLVFPLVVFQLSKLNTGLKTWVGWEEALVAQLFNFRALLHCSTLVFQLIRPYTPFVAKMNTEQTWKLHFGAKTRLSTNVSILSKSSYGRFSQQTLLF